LKRILIGIPTANDIHPQTFKSIYDQIIPAGYKADFQFFYGYNVDQVRNLIADWTVKGFDYLFAVDHDVSFAPDTIMKLLAHDKPAVSGLYRQRLEPQAIEVYDMNLARIPWSHLKGRGLVQVGGFGLGCVLIKKEVFATVGYPQFVYYDALDHKDTFSEDLDFCRKATRKGFTMWADTSIVCGHHGHKVFTIVDEAPPVVENPEKKRLRELGAMRLLPQIHTQYLASMKNDGLEPKVIYDIGACVLHWTNEAKTVWPNSQYVLFEAMDATKFLYEEGNYLHNCGLLSSEDEKVISFYENTEHPGGNSVYKENIVLSPRADELFPEEKKVRKISMTLDTVVNENNFPMPDLIKMDIQGAELDVLKGAANVLKNCNHVILELQHVDYNFGAPKSEEVIEYMKGLGFSTAGMFCGSSALDVDGDYHFTRD
jgi:FkbM family methyltransferase